VQGLVAAGQLVLAGGVAAALGGVGIGGGAEAGQGPAHDQPAGCDVFSAEQVAFGQHPAEFAGLDRVVAAHGTY
jgi:hypothetical protein